MRRRDVSFRPEALADLISIFQFIRIASKSARIAKGFVSRIRARCERIGNIPLGGRPRDDLEPGLRTVAFERSIVIAYTVENDRVRITNIFYGGRDYEALYRGVSDDPDAF